MGGGKGWTKRIDRAGEAECTTNRAAAAVTPIPGNWNSISTFALPSGAPEVAYSPNLL